MSVEVVYAMHFTRMTFSKYYFQDEGKPLNSMSLCVEHDRMRTTFAACVCVCVFVCVCMGKLTQYAWLG